MHATGEPDARLLAPAAALGPLTCNLGQGTSFSRARWQEARRDGGAVTWATIMGSWLESSPGRNDALMGLCAGGPTIYMDMNEKGYKLETPFNYEGYRVKQKRYVLEY